MPNRYGRGVGFASENSSRINELRNFPANWYRAALWLAGRGGWPGRKLARWWPAGARDGGRQGRAANGRQAPTMAQGGGASRAPCLRRRRGGGATRFAPSGCPRLPMQGAPAFALRGNRARYATVSERLTSDIQVLVVPSRSRPEAEIHIGQIDAGKRTPKQQCMRSAVQRFLPATVVLTLSSAKQS